jgi:NET1-associated nuclear protein 1 (U3 small nucleolar RNA-associated protein 17)
LPHLSAAIDDIVVSPTGTSYAIHLSDNSTMILSTVELIPTANIAGLQAHVIQTLAPKDSSIRRVKETVRTRPLVPKTPAIINPAQPSRLIIAVGENQTIDPRSTASFSTQYLQTFDVASNHNISRQALTRTNVTNNNVSPSGMPISEPIITQMQTNHDGSWLATVDEWVPPKRDVESLGLTESSIKGEQQQRREVYLKFWQWEASDETWALVNRIDSPHHTETDSFGTGRVLALAADPSSTTFSTIGDDGVVSIWQPRTRKRAGVVMKGEKGKAIYSWACQRRISMGSRELSDDSATAGKRPEHASLAFSEDGSVLAAALDGGDDHVVHLLDPFTGLIRVSRPVMYRGDLISMAFLGQYLIILSDDLQVHDLVADELQYGVELEDIKTLLSLEQKAEMMHLAVDRKSRTFAVALPCREEWDLEDKKTHNSIAHAYSEIAIFSPEHAKPLYTQTWPALATAIVPAVSSPGYIIIDTAAEVTSLAPKAVQTLVSMSKPMVELRLDLRSEQATEKTLALDDDAEDVEDDAEEAEEMDIDEALLEDDDGAPVVTQQQLARVFDVGPSFAMPPIDEMFYQVADLFSSKPTAQ